MLFYSSAGDFDRATDVEGSVGGGNDVLPFAAVLSFIKGLTSTGGTFLVLAEGVLGSTLSVSAR